MSELDGLVWPDVADGSWTLLVPLGSTEQHGPHLPLDTDTRIASAVAHGAASGRPDVLVAPALAFGASGEHAGFAGTLSIGTEALATVMIELVRSAGPEFGRIVFVNGHGGNLEAARSALTTLRAEGRAVEVWSPSIPDGDAHAGRTETSLLLHLAPESVRLDVAEPGATRPLAELWPELRASGVLGVSPNGVLGDPTGATAEEGERIVAELVRSLGILLDRE